MTKLQNGHATRNITPSSLDCNFTKLIHYVHGGRTTDQFTCRDSNHFTFLEPGDEIMADRSFQIKEDLPLYYCSLSVPPGTRVRAQMTLK